ncbi:MAG: glycosyltransferase family 2 protein [Bryobacteraceae bacterium]
MPGPVVTIITPSYNQGRFIRSTIESVLSQNYPELEYIVMDGGSTDETAAVVKEYSSRLTFISEKDRGQSHAINKGFHIARGSVLAWLNSDDLYLPGSIRAAVDAFARNPVAGAVYGEGYLIDSAGKSPSRFPWTQSFDLWRLTHLSDYILQQTVFFRRGALDEVGYLDEDLHYTMDWDILIRLGKKYPLEYIPAYMACLREYPEAKSFAGGMRRVSEIRSMLSRHTGMLVSPGYVVYGLDTYHQVLCRKVDQLFLPRLPAVAEKLRWLIRYTAGKIVSRTVRESQGLYADGWAGPVLRYMLPEGRGELTFEGSTPRSDRFQGQQVCISANGIRLGQFQLPPGDFRLTVPLPPELESQSLNLKIKAAHSAAWMPETADGHPRRLAYLLKSIRRSGPSGDMLCEKSSLTRSALAD